tara:strand:+ start:74 stop:547 length:474 start_codon:yes stop_codon:yes gene_type:complete
MEYVDFLNKGAKLVYEQVVKAGYDISENSPYCLMGEKILALHDGKNQTIHLCTRNLKSILLWDTPAVLEEDLSDSRNREATYLMSNALTHEATHAAQYCNNGNLIAPERASEEVTEWKSRSIGLSLVIGGTKAREEEAYLLESDPYFIADAVKKYCF